MIDESKRFQKQQEKDRTRKRMNVKVDPDNYEYFPAKKQLDYYDEDVNQKIAIYVRVSTDNVMQTTSYELQKKYYEDFVVRHPNWTLVKIYADEGISGTSLRHRTEFNNMITDCKAGKIDMIICKNVSRFARNVTDCIGIVRDLAALKHPVGVFFESECIFSLRDDSQMGLTFLATMAEEESHTRSRSMETSLRMRLDNGIPLTPKLLGYTHDADGHLIVNQQEAPTVKLAFFMYLYGYSSQQIADTLIALGRKSYLGNIKWTSGSVVQILRNERHCGDVLTRKTFTPNYRDHLSKKNRGERPQSRYLNHHTGIVSRDDFIAVQRMLDNAKYGNRGVLPELRVIDKGLLKGFVIINPRWSGFKEADYFQASQSVYPKVSDEEFQKMMADESTYQLEVEEGDFDLRGFEITRSEFFNSHRTPAVSFYDRKIKFNATCVHRFDDRNYVELLVNPIERKFAVRPTDKKNRNAVVISKKESGKNVGKDIPAAAFFQTLFSILGWKTENKYKVHGQLLEKGKEWAYIFDAADSEVYLKSYLVPCNCAEDNTSLYPLLPSGKRVRAIPESWTQSFGKQFYVHELSYAALADQTEKDWKLRIEGQLFETGRNLHVTSFDELRQYIREELASIEMPDTMNEQ